MLFGAKCTCMWKMLVLILQGAAKKRLSISMMLFTIKFLAVTKCLKSSIFPNSPIYAKRTVVTHRWLASTTYMAVISVRAIPVTFYFCLFSTPQIDFLIIQRKFEIKTCFLCQNSSNTPKVWTMEGGSFLGWVAPGTHSWPCPTVNTYWCSITTEVLLSLESYNLVL